jgi:hypothetical protein
MSLVDLNELFRKLEGKRVLYCIVKEPINFPQYSIGSDIDIFSYDTTYLVKEIVGFLNRYIDDDNSVVIESKIDQVYVDLMLDDKIHLRFDLYQKFPAYTSVKIKDSFFSSVLENSISKKYNNCLINVPSIYDECLIRYIEYIEWFSKRPDKIKHIDYLEDSINRGDIDRVIFFQKLHYYLQVPRVDSNRGVSTNTIKRRIWQYSDEVKKGIKYFQKHGLKNGVNKLKSRFI